MYMQYRESDKEIDRESYCWDIIEVGACGETATSEP